MQFGKVLGAASATMKHPSLEGWRMLVVRLLMHDGETADGDPVLAIAAHGAAPGSRVPGAGCGSEKGRTRGRRAARGARLASCATSREVRPCYGNIWLISFLFFLN